MPVLMGHEGGEDRSRRWLGWRHLVGIRILGFVAILIGLAMVADADAAEYDVPSGDTAALIRAIDNANRSRGADTIRLAPGRYEVTAVHNTTRGQNGLPVITSEITIEGDGLTNTTIFRSPDVEDLGLFRIARQGHLTLKKLTLQGGDYWSGSGIFNERGGTLTIEASGLTGLHNAIWNEGQAAISWSTFKGNTSVDDCSVINNSDSGTFDLSQSSLLHNSGGDGGISSICNDGTAEIAETTFDGNYGVSCGAIYQRTGELTLTKSSITKSSNDGAFPNICIAGGQATISESTIAHNQGGLGVWGGRIGNRP